MLFSSGWRAVALWIWLVGCGGAYEDDGWLAGWEQGILLD